MGGDCSSDVSNVVDVKIPSSPCEKVKKICEMSRGKSMKFAIIGIGCRLPGKEPLCSINYIKGQCDSPDEFFEKLKNKVDLLQVMDGSKRYNLEYCKKLSENHPMKVASSRGGLISNNFDEFDYKCFNFSKKEASTISPQQKILLETTLEAFEDANVDYKGSNTGVFVGAKIERFSRFRNKLYFNEYDLESSYFCMQANLVSFKFDLRGPSLVLDTACSGGGYSMFVALNSMKNGDCDMAVVGSTNLHLDLMQHIEAERWGALSKTGRCNSFDVSADGFARSEGVCSVIIRPYHKAIKDGNRIYAIIHEVKANCDGAASNTITTPSEITQGLIMRKAFSYSGTKPKDVFFMECHATGTKVGDPIEANSCGSILSVGRNKNFPIRTGSVKGNCGHCESSAYFASLIKCCMMLKHGELVPNIHLNNPNPKIKFKEYNIQIQLKNESFNPKGKLICISSFGFGGANACTIIEGVEGKKYVRPESLKKWSPPYMYIVYGRSKKGLENRIEKLKEYSEKNVDKQVELMSTLMYLKQRHYHYMSFGVGNTLHESNFGDFSSTDKEKPKICFLFSGQGPQNVKMGRDLYKTLPVFRKTIDECDVLYKKIAGFSIVHDVGMFGEKVTTDEELKKSENTIPSLIMIQLALFEFWKSVGIKPDVVMGHSFGEICSAYATGCCSLKNVLEIVHARVKIIQSIKTQGKLFAFGAGTVEFYDLQEKLGIEKTTWIAAKNSPKALTVGGTEESILKLAKECKDQKIFHRVLSINHAFHTPLVNEAKELALKLFGEVTKNLSKPKINFVSTTYDGEYFTDIGFSAKYFWDNISECVCFQQGIESVKMGYGEDVIFLELAAHPVLSYSLKQCDCKNVLFSISRKFGEQLTILQNIGKFASLNHEINFKKIVHECERLKDLPRYAYAKEVTMTEKEYFYWKQKIQNLPALLGNKIDSPDVVWENNFNLNTHEWLKDHVIQGSPLFPGAGFVELFYELFNNDEFKEKSVILKNIKTVSAMPLEENSYRVVQTMKKREGDVLEVWSKSDNDIKERIGRFIAPRISKR